MWNRIKKHLRFEWTGYIIILAISLLWVPIMNNATAPKRDECISIVFIGDGLNTVQLQERLTDILPSLSDEDIKQVRVVRAELTALYKDQELYSIADQADIVIFESQKLSEESVSFYFDCVKDTSFLASLGADEYSACGSCVGVSLSGKNNFSPFYSGDKECIAVFGYKSRCLGTLNGMSGNEAGLKLLEWLVEV